MRKVVAVMRTKTAKVRGFRPTPQNAERLDYAMKLGISCNKLINDVLAEHLPAKLSVEVKSKQKQLREALAAPMPA